MTHELGLFTKAYFEALYWTEVNSDTGIDPEAELSNPDRLQHEADCEEFYMRSRHLLAPENLTQAGHDFWLTRNHHGAGFWDRPEVYGRLQAQALTDLAHGFGEVHGLVWEN